MLGANDIPNEILAEIFSLRVDVTPYLSSLSLVCRRFHSVVGPILYSEVIITKHTPSGIPCFLRTILSRPILTHYVSLLDVSWVYISRASIASGESPQNPSDHRLFATAATSVGHTHPVDQQADQVALLLYLLPKLSVLLIDPPGEHYPWQDPDIVERTIAEHASTLPADLPSALRCVRTITFGPDGSEVSPTALFTMLTLPCIREIDIHVLIDAPEVDTARVFTPASERTSRVTSLRFGYGTIGPVTLGRILAMPRALTRFSYIDYDGRPDGFDVAVFWEGLQRCGETLQELELWFRIAGMIEARAGGGGGVIGSLRGWPALRSVRCQVAVFLGREPRGGGMRLREVVPEVMTELMLDDDEYWKYAEVVEEVVEMLRQRSCERLVTVGVGGNWQGLEEGLQGRLDKACADTGVVFTGYKWRER